MQDFSNKFEDYVATIIDGAFKHTGNPVEGDYLSYQFSTFGYGGPSSEILQNGNVTLPFSFVFFTTKAEEETVNTKVNTVLNSLNLDGLTQYKQLKKIYTWICDNIVYDESIYISDTDKAHSAYKGLIEGTCVCQGYACILYRLALERGIDARIVSGDLIDPSGGHAWNIVQMGEKYYLCDSTWDAPTDSYSYFLRGANYFTGHASETWDPAGNTGREDIMTTYSSKIDANDYEEPAECTHVNRTKVEAKNPTCTADGNIEYWQCASCEAKFTAQTGGTECTGNAWKRPAAGHQGGNHIAAKAATCTADGNYEYWTCANCSTKFRDSSRSDANVFVGTAWKIVATGHQGGSHIAAKAATCTADGNYEYWTCSNCSTKFRDSSRSDANVFVGTAWKIVATGHHVGNHVVAKAPTCTADGNREYWTCTSCDCKFKNDGLTQLYAGNEWILSKYHNELSAHPAVAATPTASGNSAYWSCSACGKYFEDAAGTQEISADSWILPPGTPAPNPPGGGGGSSGGGGGDAAAEEPTTEATEGVSVESEGGVSEVKIDESKIKGILDGCMTESVEIKFSTGLKASTDGKIVLSLPSQLVAGTKDKDKGMKISSEVGTIEFNSAALKKVANGAVTMSITQTVKNDRTNIDITMKSGKKAVTKFGTGTVSITAPLPANVKASEACVVYVSSTFVIDMGAKVSNGNVVFSTNHFSTYSIMNSSTAKPDLIKSIKKSTLGKIKATSTKKTVKLTWNNAKGNTPTDTLIYRSTKAKKGFKKIATLTNGSKTYTDKAKLKKGKKYYYKVCGSCTVDGKKYNLKKSKVVTVKHK